MEESILKSPAGAGLRVHIVWVPMLAGDDKDAADAIGATVTDPRVRQYWDPNRLCGIAYSKHVFPNWPREMVSSLPKDDELRDHLKPRLGAPPEKAPMWDIAFLYPAGARWTDSPPRPDRWAKQVMFYDNQKDGPTGRFWRDDFAKPPFDSDWYDELARWGRTAPPPEAAPPRSSRRWPDRWIPFDNVSTKTRARIGSSRFSPPPDRAASRAPVRC